VTDGDCSSWDYSRTYGCYVSGYYTDSNCTKGMSTSSFDLALSFELWPGRKTDHSYSETWPLLILTRNADEFWEREMAGWAMEWRGRLKGI